MSDKLMSKTSRYICDSEGSGSMLQDRMMSILDNSIDEVLFAGWLSLWCRTITCSAGLISDKLVIVDIISNRRQVGHRFRSRMVYLAGTIARKPTSQALPLNSYLESGRAYSGGDKQEPPQITEFTLPVLSSHHSQTFPIIS